MENGTLKVSNIQTSSGSGTITLGKSGETINISLFEDSDFEVRLNKKGLAEVKGKFIKRFDSVEFGLGNLHVVDFSLFWGSIRENVKLRLNEYMKESD